MWVCSERVESRSLLRQRERELVLALALISIPKLVYHQPQEKNDDNRNEVITKQLTGIRGSNVLSGLVVSLVVVPN